MPITIACLQTGDSTATYYTSGVKPAQGRQQWQNQVAASSSANWRVVPAPPPPDMDSTVFSTHRPPVMPPPPPPVPVGIEKNAFSYEELAAATGGFSEANLLGQGGFGYVHRGVLPGGKEVAVKQLKAGSGQGEREFQAEVDMISRVHHRHLVSLVGYCIAGARRLLVYDFVPNQTLEHHLHGTYAYARCIFVDALRRRRRCPCQCRERLTGDGVDDETAHRGRVGQGDHLPARGL
jgi:hypothetical protein